MDLKKELATKIISIAALVVLGYIFFISVYNQIIVQSGGFFYVIIFGGILILAFVLLSLVTKILDISDEVNDNFMWDVVEILLLCFSAYLFLIFRLSYRSSVPAEETIIYRAAALMKEHSLSTKGMDMISHLIMYPSQYVYARFLSVFFRMTDTGSGAFITLNAVVLILTAFVMDRVVRRIAGRACGLLAALCTLFIPSQSFAVYSYSSEFFLCLIMILTFDVLLMVTDNKKRDKKRMIAYDAIFGFLLGFLCFTEPLTFVCIVAFLVYFASKRKVKDHMPVHALAVICSVMIVVLLILTISKASVLNKSFGDVAGGAFKRFSISKNPDTDEKYSFGEVFKRFHSNLDNQNSNVNDNYLFLEGKDGEAYTRTNNAWFTLGTQMSYMFIIVMAIACAYYMLRNRHREITPCLLLLFGSFIMLLYRSTKENSTYFLFEVLMIIGCTGVHYMYLNHHSDIPVLLSEMANSPTTMSPAALAGTLARAKALIFVDHSRDKDQKIDISAEETIAQQSGDDRFMTDNDEELSSGLNEGIASEFSIFSGGTPDYDDGAFGGQIGDMFGTVPGAELQGVTEAAAASSGDFITQSMVDTVGAQGRYTEGEGSMDNVYDDFLYGTGRKESGSFEDKTEEYPEDYAQMVEDYPEEYPEDYTETVEDYPEEYSEDYTETVEDYPEEYPEDYTETAEEYPEDYAETAEEYPEEFTESYSEYGEDVQEYAEEYEDYPEEIEDYPEEIEDYPEEAEDYPEQPGEFFDHGYKEGIDYETTYFDEPESDTDEPLPGYEDGLSIYAEDYWFDDEADTESGTSQSSDMMRQDTVQASAVSDEMHKDAAPSVSQSTGTQEESEITQPQGTTDASSGESTGAVKKKVIKKKVVRRVVKKTNQ